MADNTKDYNLQCTSRDCIAVAVWVDMGAFFIRRIRHFLMQFAHFEYSYIRHHQ